MNVVELHGGIIEYDVAAGTGTMCEIPHQLVERDLALRQVLELRSHAITTTGLDGADISACLG